MGRPRQNDETVIALKRNRILAEIRRAAIANARCPTNKELGQIVGKIPYEASVPELARQGFIEIETYGQNWRVVVIDGLRTMAPPHGGKPYHVINAENPRRF